MAGSRNIVFLYKAANVPDQIVEAAKAGAPDGFTLHMCEAETPDGERRELVAAADYIMAYGVGFDDLDVVRDVGLFQILSAGYDRFDLPGLAKAGIPLATNGGANAPTVAEHALLLMLAVYKKLPLHHNTMVAGQWLGHREVLGMRELRGKQVGIVGFGKIGQEVARMVNGFLASVAYYDVVDAGPAVERELKARRLPLEELLETSDVVTVHTPLTKSSEGLIDAAALARMKDTAILINTARGPAVVEADLIEALRNGVIAAAGLDVFENEPLEDGSPLRKLDNVVLTPHNAGATLDTWTRRLYFAFENIGRVSRGEAPLFVVNG